ncbi:MAG: signal peptidase II [Clostridiales bacterium]|nr:signal peptidase II [Clostridiales bacterium]
MLWIIIAALVIAIDQGSKYLISVKIPYGEMIPVLGDFFQLTYHHNQGAAWGILQNARYFFVTLTIIVVAVMIYILFKTDSKFLKLSLSFLIGGAVGNLIDRIIRGGVTDFLNFFIGSYNFPTFNAADMSIVFGTILLAVYLLFIYKEPEKVKKTDESGTVQETVAAETTEASEMAEATEAAEMAEATEAAAKREEDSEEPKKE